MEKLRSSEAIPEQLRSSESIADQYLGPNGLTRGLLRLQSALEPPSTAPEQFDKHYTL